MDIQDFVPAGGGSLRTRVVHDGKTVGTFTTPTVHQDEHSPQAHPRPLRPGSGIEHEPVDGAERASEKTAQNAAAFDHAETSRMIRSALRPGV